MPKPTPSKKSSAKKSNIFVRAINKFSNLHTPAKVLVLAVTIGVVGGGGFAVYSSYAASYIDQSGCNLRGRVWTGSTTSNPCSNTCQSGAGSIVTATPYNYCSGAISKISSTTCSTNNRKWVSPGCARRWQQTDQANAIQCVKTGMTYKVQSTVDKCVVTTTSSTSSSGITCTITVSPTPANGVTSKYTLSVKNGTSNTIKTALGELSVNGSNGSTAVGQTVLGDIAPGQSKTGSISYALGREWSWADIKLLGGTPTSDFANCTKTWSVR